MTGLCGWFSREPAALPIARMAAALGGSIRSVVHGGGAAALAQEQGQAQARAQASLHQEDGLTIVVWGERGDLLAQLWRSLGTGACATLSGRFAFALYDERRGEGLIAVDRCASRPLFYQSLGRTLVFASSMEALARHPGAGHEADPQALFDYLYLGGAAGPRPLLAGQRRLAPGECLHLRGGRVERTRYWRMRYAEHVEENVPHGSLLDALAGAVAPVGGDAGVLLGGGAGSALLTALLGKAAGAPVHTYALGFGRGTLGTLGRIAVTARALGSRHRERLLEPRDVVDAVPLLADAADGPCGDQNAVAMLYGARMAREDGLPSVVGAHGGATLFGLDRRYAALARPGRYERLPAALRQLLIEPLLFGAAGGLEGHAARLRGRIEDSMAPVPRRLRGANALRAHGAAGVFERGFLAQVDPELAAAAQEAGWWLAQARSPVNRAIDLALQGDLPCRVLPSFDAACGAAGVATRLPFLADAVVAMSARLAPRHKGANGARAIFRRALREAGCGLAAPGVRAPLLPFGRWLREDAGLRALAFDSLSALNRRHILRREFIDLLLARRLPEDPERHGQLVWQLMMLEQWLARRVGQASRPHRAETGADLDAALQA